MSLSDMSKVLVTGGRGRLAQALVAAGAAAGVEVTALPRSALDITNPVQVARQVGSGRYGVVVNPAAVSGLEAAEAAPDLAHAANVTGPELLARACAREGVPLVHVSTDYVFGAPTERLWREADPVSPVNAYGRFKAEGEARVAAAGGAGCIVRVAWLFGDDKDFIAQMLRRGSGGEPVRVAEDQVGSPTPLEPLAARLLMLCGRLASGERGLPPILHLAGSPPVSRADWVAAAFDLLRESGAEPPPLLRTSLASFPSTATRPAFSALDSSLAQSLFGAPLDWRAGLAEAVRRGVYSRERDLAK
jgi:dTDP-4-dehydrorhamnose reductase